MSQASAIARNYAKALFSVALKDKTIDKIADNLEKFKSSFSEDFARELQNPVISKTDLIAIMEEINNKASFDETFANFLLALASNKRIGLFLEIYDEFVTLLKDHNNIVEAEIVFASDSVDAAQIEQIKQVIQKEYSGKTIEIKQRVDAKILGGFQVRIGSNIVDASLKNQIFNLKQELVN